ncbi:MAG: hypothetical protein RR382_13765 [Tannerellaceae bacterium]
MVAVRSLKSRGGTKTTDGNQFITAPYLPLPLPMGSQLSFIIYSA